VPFQVRRSGLILVLVSTPGTASIIAEAIDHSSLTDQVGTLAGDNTVLVLFPDETRLERWRERLLELQAAALS
jgi:transcriptional regulator of arginine metabolism